ncbi:hypothetical protein HN371_24750 [Candidatus Poribacteria bacterium]|jgi:hypothetical protein|nr:hypothetical protein [Candidatus Poribacteria bacterium]MBT5533512.1 hypothetical protein [Candidatus Poribacteria bacterium]MBT5714230.1 hypothetical protein [Candidatus Poribacteria bacterium]MBT7097968.1 hypothetical protein [Candidatus Poribacteria bacterium]MBT7807215.1 hypothetical protein [Candidatus Poribacteria bacterium]
MATDDARPASKRSRFPDTIDLAVGIPAALVVAMNLVGMSAGLMPPAVGAFFCLFASAAYGYSKFHATITGTAKRARDSEVRLQNVEDALAALRAEMADMTLMLDDHARGERTPAASPHDGREIPS